MVKTVRYKTNPSKKKLKRYDDSLREGFLNEIKNLNVPLFYGDEVGFKAMSNLYKMWSNKGYQPQIEEVNSNIKVNVCGFINTQTGDFYSDFINKGNQNTFMDSLRMLSKANNGNEIALVLDNAKWHKTLDVKNLAKELKIKLIFLPPYAPHLNPIERVWWLFRLNRTRNRNFVSVSQIIQTFVDFFKNIDKQKLINICRVQN